MLTNCIGDECERHSTFSSILSSFSKQIIFSIYSRSENLKIHLLSVCYFLKPIDDD